LSAAVAVDLLSVDEVNDLDRDGFLARFGGVYEATPALAELAGSARPFADRPALVAAFRAAAAGLDEAGVLALLRSHPQLAAADPLSSESAGEQRGAGLVDLAADTRRRIVDGNRRYLERFGFPFIIAVRGLGPDDIVAALEERLGHDAPTELAAAFTQVQRIAELRIDQLVHG
jgi:2-oxo-4-hydroxy-4-carboxy-5-ureidoimidazoline decarboxylase